uniref:Immunoglobulin subtype domain-containing protein n=1 Tax=Amphilophus citrinellus TaxID=61819 RepID=A0A3Q0S549_AMPCI
SHCNHLLGCDTLCLTMFTIQFFFSVLLGLQHVFVQHGKDLHLDVKKPFELNKKTDLFWKFNTTNYVGKISYNRELALFGSYEGRAELFGQNYSLLLKTVQHNDSGDYTGIVTGGKEQKVAEYKVLVQVSPVNLTVTSSGSNPCNITVTCSTVDLMISRTFRCNTQNCSQVEEKSLKQDTIVCNHSNQVSWEHSNKVTNLQCEPETNNTVVIVIVIMIAVVVFTILAAFTCFRQRKKGMCKSKHVFHQGIKKDQQNPVTTCWNSVHLSCL